MSADGSVADGVPARRRRSGPIRDAERTRARILAAARASFAALGFERSTIRAIASEAGIDPAMVMRYFGSKDELFTAAIRTDPAMPDLSTVPRDHVGHEVALAFLRRWRDPAVLAILRVAPTSTDAANRVHAAYRDQLAALAARLGSPDEALERAGLVASQIVGLAMCRHVLDLHPLPEMEIETLARRIGPVLQHYLTAPLEPPPAPRATVSITSG